MVLGDLARRRVYQDSSVPWFLAGQLHVGNGVWSRSGKRGAEYVWWLEGIVWNEVPFSEATPRHGRKWAFVAT